MLACTRPWAWFLLDENEDMTPPRVGEKVYCRHEGEHSLRHLEESRLKMVSRIERAMRGEREEEEKERKDGKWTK